jgi:hypothetical protein
MSPLSSGSKDKQSLIPASQRFLLVHSSALKMEVTVPPKFRFTFIGVHGVISQKPQFFIITAVRISNPVNI